jgi:serine protease Do
VVDVFERSRDSVVNISSTEIVTVRSRGLNSIFDDFFDLPRPRAREFKRQSVGSGFVIHPAGYIATNAHVVHRTAERKVTFADGRSYDAQIIAHDTDLDLAVLKIEAGQSLQPLPYGRSDDLMVGETVIAIGNPLGYQHTVTAGVVSAVDRDLDFHNDVMLRGLIQTDASINPGNSGGPLLNVLGELIGVNTAIRGDAQNIGFAIPVDRLREVLPELLDVHRRYRIDSGLAVGGLTEPAIVEVESDSPAEEAGLLVGDVLVSIDGVPVRYGVDFDIALIGKQAGDDVRLALRRDGRLLERKLTLDGRPAPDGAALAAQRLGIEAYPLPERVARELALKGAAGLLVVNVEPGGPADKIGIERRDVLLSVGRWHISSIEELGQLLEIADPGQEVAVSVLRVGSFGKEQFNGRITVR